LLAANFPLSSVPTTIRKLPALRKSAAVSSARAADVSSHGRPDGVGLPLPGTVAAPAAVPALNATAVTPVTVLPLPVAPVTVPPPAAINPLSSTTYKVQFTASAAMIEKLREAQDLLRHQLPDGDPAEIMEQALNEFVERLRQRKSCATAHPRAAKPGRPGSRHVPSWVKREVWARDQARCAFRGRDNERCHQRGCLEYHHIEPHAVGGPATAENIELRCRAHNQYESEQYFGRRGESLVRERKVGYSLLLKPGPDRVRDYKQSSRYYMEFQVE
jgi:hypothetical protein